MLRAVKDADASRITGIYYDFILNDRETGKCEDHRAKASPELKEEPAADLTIGKRP